jgi:hypothetical protein
MRRRLALALGALAVIGSGAAPAAGSATRHYPSHLLVYAQEWSLWPSRGTVPRGDVEVQLKNRGEDPHDLRLRRLGAGGRLIGHTLGVRVTNSGQLSSATWHLGAGRFELYCSLPGHRMRGMHTVLVVR